MRLSELSEEEAAKPLANLQTMSLNDERPLWGIVGLETLGADTQGSAMHQTLLAAYDKLFATDRQASAATIK